MTLSIKVKTKSFCFQFTSCALFFFEFTYLDAAEVLRQNRRLFEQNVAKSMRGGYVGSIYFERCLK